MAHPQGSNRIAGQGGYQVHTPGLLGMHHCCGKPWCNYRLQCNSFPRRWRDRNIVLAVGNIPLRKWLKAAGTRSCTWVCWQF